MSRARDLASVISLPHPIIQAPMAGSDTPALAAAVSIAGGLGSLGCAYLSPEQIVLAARDVRARTDLPFAINLFTPDPTVPPPFDAGPMLALLAPLHDALGLPPPVAPNPDPPSLTAQIDAVLDVAPAVFSFTLGIPSQEALARMRAKGIVTIGTATTVGEALRLEAAGVDAVVAQGSEAGGHRGTFSVNGDLPLVGTMALVPQIVDVVSIPVIAAGGIMDGRGLVAARALGASAVQMGTAFLTCAEASTPDAHRAAVLASHDDSTVITSVFSGRPARGIANDFIRMMEGHEPSVLPFPAQSNATRPLRSAAATQGDARFLSLWAGQAARLARVETAAHLIARVVVEAEAVLARLRGSVMSPEPR